MINGCHIYFCAFIKEIEKGFGYSLFCIANRRQLVKPGLLAQSRVVIYSDLKCEDFKLIQNYYKATLHGSNKLFKCLKKRTYFYILL